MIFFKPKKVSAPSDRSWIPPLPFRGDIFLSMARNSGITFARQLQNRASAGLSLDRPIEGRVHVALPGRQKWAKKGVAFAEKEVAAANAEAQALLSEVRAELGRSLLASAFDLDGTEVGVRLASPPPNEIVIASIKVPLKPGVASDREGPLRAAVLQKERRETVLLDRVEKTIASIAADRLPAASKKRGTDFGYVRLSGPLEGASEPFELENLKFLADVLDNPTSAATLESRIAKRLNEALREKGWTSVETVSVIIRPDPKAFETAERSILLKLTPLPERTP